MLSGVSPNFFSIGIDCEDISRWRRMLPMSDESPQRRLFSQSEHKYCNSYKDPAPHYAARWCAKEAVLKALSPFYKIDLCKIEIINDVEGRPVCILNDPEMKKVKADVRISLSHSKEVAMAIAMVIM